MIEGEKPLVLIVEDDADQVKAMSFIVNKFGMRAEVASQAKDFITKLKTLKPQLSLVDLQLDTPNTGLALISAVRKVMGGDPVLIVASARTDRATVRQAMKAGANDYLTKPIDRHILAAKLSYYVTTDELTELSAPLIPVPKGGAPGAAIIDFEVLEIDEFGMLVLTRHLLTAGLSVPLGGELFEEITGERKAVWMTVTSVVAAEQGARFFRTALEFDPSNEPLLVKVRQWIGAKVAQNQPAKPEPK
jgi:DNA-binding response OmpR family regulator